MSLRVLASLGIALLAGSLTAQAAVIYSNFGAGDTYSTLSGYRVRSDSPYYYDHSFQFVAAESGAVTSIDVGMGTYSAVLSTPQTAKFELYADSGNTLGTLLEGFTVTIGNYWTTQATSSGALSGSTTLAAGQKYWLRAVPIAEQLVWNQNSTGAVGLLFNSTEGYSKVTTEMATFRLNGLSSDPAVPLPAAAWLLLSGVGGLGFLGRRRKAA